MRATLSHPDSRRSYTDKYFNANMLVIILQCMLGPAACMVGGEQIDPDWPQHKENAQWFDLASGCFMLTLWCVVQIAFLAWGQRLYHGGLEMRQEQLRASLRNRHSTTAFRPALVEMAQMEAKYIKDITQKAWSSIASMGRSTLHAPRRTAPTTELASGELDDGDDISA